MHECVPLPQNETVAAAEGNVLAIQLAVECSHFISQTTSVIYLFIYFFMVGKKLLHNQGYKRVRNPSKTTKENNLTWVP
jgi:hypothetical protein